MPDGRQKRHARRGEPFTLAATVSIQTPLVIALAGRAAAAATVVVGTRVLHGTNGAAWELGDLVVERDTTPPRRTPWRTIRRPLPGKVWRVAPTAAASPRRPGCATHARCHGPPAPSVVARLPSKVDGFRLRRCAEGRAPGEGAAAAARLCRTESAGCVGGEGGGLQVCVETHQQRDAERGMERLYGLGRRPPWSGGPPMCSGPAVCKEGPRCAAQARQPTAPVWLGVSIHRRRSMLFPQPVSTDCFGVWVCTVPCTHSVLKSTSQFNWLFCDVNLKFFSG